jgi:photosystem II stability/assembly factor-like uncharacterized protein
MKYRNNMKKMPLISQWFFLLILSSGILRAHMLGKNGFKFGPTPEARIAGNSISDIVYFQNALFVANSQGISVTTDAGLSWRNITQGNGLGKGGVSAFAVLDGLMWAATGYDTTVYQTKNEPQFLPAGGGVGYSTNGGETWRWMRQPVDSRDETRYKPTTTHIQNITYDLAVVPTPTDTTVWIASFGGGLRKSSDRGETWEVVTVDGNPFAPLQYLSHRVFSLLYDGEALWVGSAGGVHKSTDKGKTWMTFSHQNQTQGISGNFVVAIARQKTADRDVVWAATVETTSESKDTTEFRAVSKSEDGGLTWSTTLNGLFPHNFAFDGSVVYVAADKGLFKSLDYGETWAVFPKIEDLESGETIYETEMNCAAACPDRTFWAGSPDGLARTTDGGATWKIFRAYQTPGDHGQPETYAYPNPFSPIQDELNGGQGYVQFQYKTPKLERIATKPVYITVRVYDFGLNLVRNVVVDKERSIPGSYSESWDGRNDFGKMSDNGVYFYRIDISGETPLWGKVIIMN